MKDLQKLKIYLRGWANGRGYYEAVRAIDVCLAAHEDQMRKDGVTPFALHPLEVANIARSFDGLFGDVGESIIVLALLHDTVEDTDLTFEEVSDSFGRQMSYALHLLTKAPGYEDQAYYEDMLNDPKSVFAKLCDRLHNLSTMAGVFSQEKALAYVAETEEYIIPLAKAARARYPEHANAYQAMRYALKAACSVARAVTPS